MKSIYFNVFPDQLMEWNALYMQNKYIADDNYWNFFGGPKEG